MIAFLPEPITLDFSSVPDYNYVAFDKTEGALIDAIRQKDNRLYEVVAEDGIYPLAMYIWDDLDYEKSLIDTPATPITNQYAIDCHNDFIRIDQDVDGKVLITVYNGTTAPATVVYRTSDKKYYMSLKDNIEIDFMTQTGDPADWTDLNTTAEWRHEEILPIERNLTLDWTDIGATNRHKMFDASLNKSTKDLRSISGNTISFTNATDTISNTAVMEDIFVGDKFKITGSVSNNLEFTVATIAADRLSFTIEETGTLTDEVAGASVVISIYITILFTVTGIDRIAIFNPLCEEIVLSVLGTSHTETKSMFDDTLVDGFESYVFDDFSPVTKTIFTIPREFGVQVEIIFKGGLQDIGEVIMGKSLYLGKALDDTSIITRSYGQIIEASNGDVYFDEVDSQNKLVDRASFNISVPSADLNTYIKRKNTLINKRMVLSATDDDDPAFEYLVLYCYGRDSTAKPKTSHSKSTYSLDARTFL